jgi:anti-sigma factor RsiW
MRDTNERPFCHRAEDLVTYLYGEAGEADAADFRNHLQQCDACRSEFAVFNQVHDSILLWRNEALGASFNPAAVATEATIDSRPVVRHEPRLSALQALREFFSVSPLWLRGATAFAGLVLCALVVLAVSRSWQRPAPVATTTGEPKVFTKSDFEAAVAREVKNQTEKIQQASSPPAKTSTTAQLTSRRTEVASVHSSAKSRVKGLTRQEREQLAADLRLIPATDDEELPFALPEEPNQ